MAYDIRKYNTDLGATVQDGTLSNVFDVILVGKNYAGYGITQNENFLHLLENFSNNNPPPKAITGQLWYDSYSQKLKINSGTSQIKEWHTISSLESSDVAPTTLKVGDFWWDTANSHLYCRSSTGSNVFIGGSDNGIITQMKSRTVIDTNDSSHEIIEAVVDNDVVFIVSTDAEFTLNTTSNNIAGFTKIYPGLTLSNLSDVDYTTSNLKYWGTASDSDKLGGLSASSYINDVTPTFSVIANFADAGFSIGGTNEKLFIYNLNGIPQIHNQAAEQIFFKTTSNNSTKIPMELNGENILPGNPDITNLGSIDAMFNTVYAASFEGNATSSTLAITANGADTVLVGSSYHKATVDIATTDTVPDYGTIVVRTSADYTIGTAPSQLTITKGSIKANYFVGTATHALAGDLAEKYLADKIYETGSVLMIGGEKEVTAAQVGSRALGAVSANPGYGMNIGLDEGTFIALKGRVPVKVIGKVNKGDRLIAADLGVAIALTDLNYANLVFAIALESNDIDDIKLVEAVIL